MSYTHMVILAAPVTNIRWIGSVIGLDLVGRRGIYYSDGGKVRRINQGLCGVNMCNLDREVARVIARIFGTVMRAGISYSVLQYGYNDLHATNILV
jgi:hypothetical protein